MIAIAGFTVLIIGVLMIVTPGPAILVIPAGLSILAIEFAWARRWLAKAREYIEKAKTGAAESPHTAWFRDQWKKIKARFSRNPQPEADELAKPAATPQKSALSKRESDPLNFPS